MRAGERRAAKSPRNSRREAPSPHKNRLWRLAHESIIFSGAPTAAPNTLIIRTLYSTNCRDSMPRRPRILRRISGTSPRLYGRIARPVQSATSSESQKSNWTAQGVRRLVSVAMSGAEGGGRRRYSTRPGRRRLGWAVVAPASKLPQLASESRCNPIEEGSS